MLSFYPDYVQVVDMGTLELRITAVKPGTDGERVRNFLHYRNTVKKNSLHVPYTVFID